jgi:hypothetical protein
MPITGIKDSRYTHRTRTHIASPLPEAGLRFDA